jgi:hypothetical protein
METKEKGCSVGEKTYSRGEQVCDDERCYICEAGEWKYRYIDFLYGVGP